VARLAGTISACIVVATAAPAVSADRAPSWARFGAAPFRTSGAVSVWSGRQLFMWSGETYEGGYARAAALYDPGRRRWQRVPFGPLRPRARAGAVWTGREVVIWGGRAGNAAVARGGAFEPTTRRWRLLPPAPLTARWPVATVWTGNEVIVWGDGSRRTAARDGAAYEPVRNRWRRIARAPVALNEATDVWTGKELVVVGALLDGGNGSRTRYARGIAYNPSTNRWRVVAQSPLSPQASYAVWTGAAVLAWDYELQAAAYEPTRNSWQRRPRLPLRFTECYPRGARLGRHVLAWHCGQAAVFDTWSRRWTRLRTTHISAAGAPLSVGDRFVLVAAGRCGHIALGQSDAGRTNARTRRSHDAFAQQRQTFVGRVDGTWQCANQPDDHRWCNPSAGTRDGACATFGSANGFRPLHID
jgi:hypothetical protein